MKSVLPLLIVTLLTIPVMAAASAAPQEPEATCASLDEAECPGSVALLLAKKQADDSEIDRCSSFLINSRTLVTNRHCIPEDLRDKPFRVRGRFNRGLSKDVAFSSERAECESILKISAEALEFPTGHADYAVIRLNRPVKRTKLRISREGLPNGLQLKTFSFDPVPGSPVKAILHTKTCESLQNTDLIPGYTDAQSPVASFKGCQIIRGNSGSAAVDRQDRVRAVVHATWPVDKKYAPFSVMTNMACLDLPKGFAPRDSRCNEKRPVNFDFKTLYAKMPNLDFESEFRTFQEENRDKFRFKKLRLFSNDRVVLIPDIECVQKSALLSLTTPQALLSISLPIWGPDKFITADFHYQAVPAQVASAYTTLQFDAAKLLAEGHTLVREIRGSYFIYSDREYELSLCDGSFGKSP